MVSYNDRSHPESVTHLVREPERRFGPRQDLVWTTDVPKYYSGASDAIQREKCH